MAASLDATIFVPARNLVGSKKLSGAGPMLKVEEKNFLYYITQGE
jgi:hypothetical protein